MSRLPILWIALAVAVLCCPTQQAEADTQNWSFIVTTFHNAHAKFGTLPDALDSYDPQDWYVNTYTAFHRQHGVGWDGPTGLVAFDIRAPLSNQFGAYKTWDSLYITVSPPSITPLLPIYFIPSASFRPPAEWLYELCLDEVPEGIVYHGPYHWYLDPTLWNTIELPPANYDPAKPIPQGYRFSIKVTVIPEPCSLIAMGVGLAALGLRRRR